MTLRLKLLTALSLMLMAATVLSAPLERATRDLGGPSKVVGWWALGGYYGNGDTNRGEIVHRQ